MRLWKYCVGYVNIGIMGEYPERLVNRCTEAGMPLSNCRRCAGGLTADISMRDVKRVRRIARGCGCRLRINRKRGLPCALMRVRRNVWFFAALALFIAAALAASARVWSIRIGSSVVPEEALAECLEGMGVRVGMRRSAVSAADLREALENVDGVTNAKVRLKGVRLSVVISDREPDNASKTEDTPSDIVSDRDCVITRISVTSGRAAVKPGERVKAGDTLIRGDLWDVKPGCKVRAEGEVIAEVLYSASVTVSPMTSRLVRSGECSLVSIPSFFGREIGTGFPYGDYELEPVRTAVIACALPVSVTEYRCYELVTSLVTDTDEAAAMRARLAAQEKLFGMIPHDARITTVKTQTSKNADGSITAVINATAVERIGVRKGI